jgi:hypothetical protein
MGRSAHASVRPNADDDRVSERGLHYIEDDLADDWLTSWALAGVNEIEAYLAKHAAFLAFLEGDEA